MKRSIVLLAVIFLVVLGCNKAGKMEEPTPGDNQETAAAKRKCAADEVLKEHLKEDPSLAERMQGIERFVERFVSEPASSRLLPDGIIEIPVVVNVIYNTAAENVSDAQIASQIAVLNKDFSASNSDYNRTPSEFRPFRSGDIRITFVLDHVVRRSSSVTSWALNDGMKKSNRGGIDVTDPSTRLNIWVCDLANGFLGYAQFPGGNSSTDGVVIDYAAFGTTGSAADPFDKGRTATHEVGHWMNLYHTWGDDGNRCNGSDLVDDTPNQGDENYGCPSFPQVSCSNGPNGDMFMNYMDYTDDACMFMFTLGQKSRMQATFAAGGPRNSFAH
ncbi:MAG TPA: zinc metalloprotease [Chitinophagaceae bacterium]|nr:zinc metalloprotease [Chitinophagaceae bacterium]